MVHMSNLFCCIHFLCDNVVRMVIHSADDTQVKVEMVVKFRYWSVWVALHFHLPIFFGGDQRIQKSCLWLVRKVYAASGVDGVQVLSQFISIFLLHHLDRVFDVAPLHGGSSIMWCSVHGIIFYNLHVHVRYQYRDWHSHGWRRQSKSEKHEPTPWTGTWGAPNYHHCTPICWGISYCHLSQMALYISTIDANRHCLAKLICRYSTSTSKS